jgi:RimJ/RimL family protein N-acetyltransferase
MAALVRLRALAEDDLPALHRWYQTVELWDHLVGAFQPRPEAESLAYMRRWLTPSASERRLAIVRGANGALLGLASLSPIEPEKGEAEFHVFLGEALQRGRGYGQAATEAMLAFAFDELALWRVRLKVLKTNETALRLYARLGFEPEDLPGETVDKPHGQVAVVVMSVTDAVFRQRQAS